jgi:uncharacterized membrane protein
MKKVVPFFIVSALGLAVILLFGFSTSVSAATIFDGVNAAHGIGTPTALFGVGGIITTVTNVLLFIAGALAVIMIIYGGLRYTTSAGNSASVTAAKNTVLYAIVGLIICFLAFAVVNFVLNALTVGTAVAPTNV